MSCKKETRPEYQKTMKDGTCNVFLHQALASFIAVTAYVNPIERPDLAINSLLKLHMNVLKVQGNCQKCKMNVCKEIGEDYSL